MTTEFDYGYERLEEIPVEMEKWGIWLDIPVATTYGEYVVVGLQPADIEGAHQVLLVNENGHPLNNVYVIFGFPGGGPDIPLRPNRNYWHASPKVLKGNWVASRFGYAEHTYRDGGEDIWIWDLTSDGQLRYSSTIVRNCRWVQDRFIHTGIKITFQRRDSGIMPQGNRVERLERRVERLESALDALTPGSLADLINLTGSGQGD